MASRWLRARALQVSAALAALVGATTTGVTAQADTPALRDVVLVGNSQSGTVSFLDAQGFTVLGTFDVIPDLQQRLDEMDLVQRAGYAIVKQQEGGDRFVDDVALSPDGTRWVVSATTANEAQVLDTATGSVVGSFATGSYPHQNDFTPDGKYIYNSSIGVIAMPQALEFLKGSFQLTKVDARTLDVVQTWSFPHGIRPSVLAADGTTFYAQQSYYNGFIRYDLAGSRTTATVPMPFSPAGHALAPDSYPKNSAHHGLAISGDQSRLCDVGTIDDYTAIVATSYLGTVGRVDYPTGSLPYWATSGGPDNRYCFVSLSQANQVSVVDYATAQEVARVPVGVFPQRERLARVPVDVLNSWSTRG